MKREFAMKREDAIRFLNEHKDYLWDMIVIGGGATGLGIAMDSASRGFQVLLLEQHDFAKATSSRSTKLVHGGVRYLAQGDIKLVLEALHERGLLLQNANHLAHDQCFVVPSYGWWDSVFYAIGLKLYDLLSGGLSLGKSVVVGPDKVGRILPTIQKAGLKSGIVYHDGQFDDTRLAINIAQTAVEKGAYLLNYMPVKALQKGKAGVVAGVVAVDAESGQSYELNAKVVINATGVFVDEVLSMDDRNKAALVRPSQGTHIVLNRSFMPSDYALMIPKTSDGRVLFAIPWHGKLVLGTTDTPLDDASLEPRALNEEVDFILSNFGRYVQNQPSKKDVLSVFSGLRPLARPQGKNKSTKEISRNHKILVSDSGLITIIGGKWTTFRKMAEEAVDKAIALGKLAPKTCVTHHLAIHGSGKIGDKTSVLSVYGTDAEKIQELMEQQPSLSEKLHSSYDYVKAQVVWAARYEMARTVEDFLARRIRILFLDANAAIAMAPLVAEVLATEMSKSKEWENEQVMAFSKLAKGYLLA